MLEDAGFDIYNSSEHTALSRRVPSVGTVLSGRHQKHIQQCLFCQEAAVVDDAFLPQKVSADDHPHLITLSIGGMTCSSCPATITEMVSQLPGISELVISLLNHSATVVVARRDLIGSVTETIDDCGYEVEVVKVEPFRPLTSHSDTTTTGPRNLLLRVEGMYCQCVDLIVFT
jgi:Cu+-exporting ATPase